MDGSSATSFIYCLIFALCFALLGVGITLLLRRFFSRTAFVIGWLIPLAGLVAFFIWNFPGESCVAAQSFCGESEVMLMTFAAFSYC